MNVFLHVKFSLMCFFISPLDLFPHSGNTDQTVDHLLYAGPFMSAAISRHGGHLEIRVPVQS